MEKFLSNIDNLIDEFEFQDIRFINNQFLKTTEQEINTFLKEHKMSNTMLDIKINYILGLINKLKLQITCSYNFFLKALALAKEDRKSVV